MKKLISRIVLVFAFAFAFVLAGSTVAKAASNANFMQTEAKANPTKATKVATGDYVLVTDESELVVGRKIVIAAAQYSYAVSATQSSTNRKGVSATKKSSDGTIIMTPSSSVGTFTLTNGYYNGTFSFYDSYYDGYLCAASSSSNTLRTAYSVASYSSFSISIDNGIASVVANYFSRNTLRYNSSSKLFACYSSGQKAICLFQEYVGSGSGTSTGESGSSNVAVTGVALSKTSATLEIGNTYKLTATVYPTNATNKNVTWSTTDSSVATVSNGTVTARGAGTAYIVVTTVDGGYTAYATITVNQASSGGSSSSLDSWTIMIYMCGADLESNYQLATSDIREILSVSGQPNDVNIIIETGGAASWGSTYGINSRYLQRYHVEGRSLVLDATLTRASMGLTSTFQSFLEWGLTAYPAQKTGVIMWNHGGAMRGVCYDENYSNDSLLNSEVRTALNNAFANTNTTKKLEFIGYDACLMSVQDVAEFNSSYFNYMIASEESESGYGWDYDTWVDDLYAKRATTTILSAIVDGFIADNGGVSSYSNNQTLAYLDLAYMPAYKSAWENMAAALYNKLTSSNKSSFRNLVAGCKHYADDSYTYYGIFDAKDFITKISSSSTFNPGSTYTNAVLSAFSNLVGYSSCGRGAGNSNGLCMFFSISSSCSKSTYYSSSQTNFSNWRALVSTYGA